MRALSLCLVFLFVLLPIAGSPAAAQRLDGFDVIASPGHAFGTASAEQSLRSAQARSP
jgi:hypothetical protein